MRHKLDCISSRVSLLAFATAYLLLWNVAAGRTEPKITPFGLWLTQAGDAKVLIRPCGDAICGKVTWLKEPINSASGKPYTDAHNPDPRLKTRPIIGLELLITMRSTSPNSWSGKIYNANNGRIHAGSVTSLDDGRLEVKGCNGPVCVGEIWTRDAS